MDQVGCVWVGDTRSLVVRCSDVQSSPTVRLGLKVWVGALLERAVHPVHIALASSGVQRPVSSTGIPHLGRFPLVRCRNYNGQVFTQNA